MKNTLFDSITISLSALALTTSLSAVAANTEPAANNSAHTENTYTEKTYTEKRSAAEFWADFKQDSKQTWQDSKAAFKDGWIESKLETALILNEHLNAFKIDIEVDKDMATLGGEVHSDIEKELAENIALGVEGIDAVTNNIKVIEKPAKTAESVAPQGRNFAQYVADVSTTAAIKTELLASPNIKGLAIDVDTLNHKVTLSGQVSSLEQKALAQAIAAKHENVKGVVNNLQIKS
ncbi:histidine kinase [Cellvibrio sp. BR]|uniref:BON domain-containing protein n=1 Tax=unclassified Cellvibrio TaxID=2624793 RepID=UPI00026013C1|nr:MULTISPECIES: BON domain-containing protein [unclassified Cellvibrio]EIK45303.1 histidine kinase [Cellvibrio sp. BR]QEY13353.1 BON domain-containing protein [Cellvibrio sp. KY-YJ-3]